VRTERRHSPRMTVKGLAYVNLAPDNGGVILDVSEGGLCFQSRAPVHTVDAIRFWFSYRRQRVRPAAGQAQSDEPPSEGVSQFIEACCDVAWIDATRKRGGLKFKNLPEAARGQIRQWMQEPAVPYGNGPLIPRSSLATGSLKLAQISSGRLREFVRHIQTTRRRTGFSGGLVSGILLSAALLGLFSLLIHSHRLGDSLVQLGEWLGGRSSTPSIAPSLPQSPETFSTSAGPPPSVSPDSDSQTLAAPAHVPPPDKSASTVLPAVAKPADVRPEPASHAFRSVSRALARPVIPEPGVRLGPEWEESVISAPAPNIESANPFAVRPKALQAAGDVTGSEKYLEVGKFKEKLLADKEVDRLSRLDFPANVNQSNRFFGKSYQVLVGPYETDSEAETVHKELSSHGFNPRSYERGKRSFRLRPGLKVGTTYLPVGDCMISWESYMPDAIVKIETPQGRQVTLEGKWEKQVDKYSQDAIAYTKDRDGSLMLVEVRFSGLRRTLVFPRGK